MPVYDDEHDKEQEYQCWLYYRESAYEERQARIVAPELHDAKSTHGDAKPENIDPLALLIDATEKLQSATIGVRAHLHNLLDERERIRLPFFPEGQPLDIQENFHRMNEAAKKGRNILDLNRPLFSRLSQSRYPSCRELVTFARMLVSYRSSTEEIFCFTQSALLPEQPSRFGINTEREDAEAMIIAEYKFLGLTPPDFG